MPVVLIALSEEVQAKLRKQYQALTVQWSGQGADVVHPSFEQWLAQRAAGDENMPAVMAEVDNLRAFHAIEKLVTGLHRHGFELVNVGKNGVFSDESTHELARSINTDLKLQPQYLKRIQDLLEHYLKSIHDVTDAAHMYITKRGQTALNEAYAQLIDRATTGIDELGAERAIGRVEGSTAMLVSVEAMDRNDAQDKTDVFKIHARTAPRANWVGKVFKHPPGKE